MDRINHASANNGRFVAKDPNIDGSGTVLTAEWHNDIQDELINLITKSGLTPNRTDLDQLFDAVDEIAKRRTTVIGGWKFGAIANIFSGRIVYDGGVADKIGDYEKVTLDSDFNGAGYLHLNLSMIRASMPKIDITGLEYGSNRFINETASAYLSNNHGGIYHQNNSTNGNNPIFYRSSTALNSSKYFLRVKINTSYFNLLRINAMDAFSINPLDALSVISGVLTTKEFI